MSDLKKIKLPDGNTYDLVDQGARELIAELAGSTAWLGKTTTPLTDGATTNPIMIDGVSKTAKKGNITAYEFSEFIFSGTKWQEFGDLSHLGSLAYKNKATGTYKPYGRVSQPIFTGTEETISVDTTPSGTVSKPDITITPTTTDVNSITHVGTLPSCTMPVFGTSVTNETLIFEWTNGQFDPGTLPTKGANTTVMTAATAELDNAPVFTGTSSAGSATYRPKGTISVPDFVGTTETIEVQ